MEQTGLSERVAREKAAYDGGTVFQNSSKLQARFYHVFSCPNSQHAERVFEESIVSYAKGRDILDYGCLGGGDAPRYRAMGARNITGIDISETGIAEANANFGAFAKFFVADAHSMPFEDNSFDLVVGRAILHHLNLDRALNEIRRVLRPGGSAIFIEPLGGNPGAKFIRALTPRARTADERALTRQDIVKGNVVFGGESHHFFNLVSVPVAMLTSLTPMGPDNILLRLADIPDRILARSPLKYWMRMAVLVWHKA
jgi:SAM-dependent methyltransferase